MTPIRHLAGLATRRGEICGLAKNMELRLVAEGVETIGQREILEGLGCELAQGFHLTPPLPSEEVSHLIAREVSAGLQREASMSS